MHTITLGRIEMTGLRFTGRDVKRDGNWYPETEPAPKAVAMVWLNAGTVEDAQKAKAYADREGYQVFTLPLNAKDPIATTKALLITS